MFRENPRKEPITTRVTLPSGMSGMKIVDSAACGSDVEEVLFSSSTMYEMKRPSTPHFGMRLLTPFEVKCRNQRTLAGYATWRTCLRTVSANSPMLDTFEIPAVPAPVAESFLPTACLHHTVSPHPCVPLLARPVDLEMIGPAPLVRKNHARLDVV
jgi:hypothetical protein